MKSLGDIRAFAEEVAGAAPLLGYPRNEAILHSFRLAQSLNLMNQIGAVYRGRAVPGYDGMRYTQDLLRWLTYRIFTQCPSGGSLTAPTSDEHTQPALTTLTDFIFFSFVQDALVSTRAQFFHLEIFESERLVRFVNNPEIANRQVRRMVAESSEREREIAAMTASAEREPMARNVPQVRLNGDKLTLEYRFTERLAAGLCPDLPLPTRLIAPAVDLGSYSLDDFWLFWRHLARRMAVHDMLLIEAAKQLDMKWTAHNSAALVFRKRDLLGEIRYFTGLRQAVAAEILRDLTYSPDLTPDVIYQPLVPLSGQRILTLPLLILGANPERNLLALIGRLPWRKHGAEELKRVRESLMIDDIVMVADELGLSSRPRINLGMRGSTLVGEVDLLIWSDASFALAVSLKWFYGPDSMQEVCNHDEQFREGLTKLERHLRYLRENAVDVSTRYSLHPRLSAETEFAGLIVSKMGTASELVHHDDLPIVTLERFLEGLRAGAGDLRGTHAAMSRLSGGEEYPEVQFQPRERVLEMRGWRFSFPQVELIEGEPQP